MFLINKVHGIYCFVFDRGIELGIENCRISLLLVSTTKFLVHFGDGHYLLPITYYSFRFIAYILSCRAWASLPIVVIMILRQIMITVLQCPFLCLSGYFKCSQKYGTVALYCLYATGRKTKLICNLLAPFKYNIAWGVQFLHCNGWKVLLQLSASQRSISSLLQLCCVSVAEGGSLFD